MTGPSEVRVIGPLLPYVAGFREDLARYGYTPLSAANQIRVLAHLSRWMVQEGVRPDMLGPDLVAEFLRVRRDAGYTCWLSERGVAPLLRFLRGVGAVPEPVQARVDGKAAGLLEEYRDVLVYERGLAATTVERYLSTARFFLARCAFPDRGVEGLNSQLVRTFVVDECRHRSVGAMKNLVCELRSLLRFLFVAGLVPDDLSSVVPAVAGRRDKGLPRSVDQATVSRLLASCDRKIRVGRRDLAILTLLSRLGLRAVEVAAIRLEDVDWRSGQILIRGKGDRRETLPLPIDVGTAVVSYLQDGRPRSECRSMFLGAVAPHAPFTASAVKAVVRYACIRAGIPVIGPHRLRHSAATELLRAGAGLNEIGQILRHQSLATTAIYAKVDTTHLRELAVPWPGGAR